MERIKCLAERFQVATSAELDSSGALKLQEEEEQISHTCDNVTFFFGESVDAGKGTLFITTRRIVWVSSVHTGLALALRYPQVIMHAISKDTSSFPQACIYLQLDEDEEDAMMAGAGSDGEEEEEAHGEDEDVPAEVRLVLADMEKIEEVFKALCDCAALNPDSDGEAEGEGDFFFDETEVLAGLDDATRAQLMAARMEGGAMALEDVAEGGDLDELVGEDEGRFEDDDE